MHTHTFLPPWQKKVLSVPHAPFLRQSLTRPNFGLKNLRVDVQIKGGVYERVTKGRKAVTLDRLLDLFVPVGVKTGSGTRDNARKNKDVCT